VKRFTIFLDIDGVLHPTSFIQQNQFKCLPFLIKCLEPFLDQLEIVISSSWRFQYDLPDLVNLFPSPISAIIVNTTGDTCIGRFSRFMEIKNYVRNFDIENWIAIDDSRFEFPEPLPSYIILCNPNFGFGTEEAKRLIKMLKI
jgi:hypothetical protein